MSRPDKVEWAMKLARVTAERSTCARRAVGCVLLDKNGKVLATGYNGVARGLPHCNEGAQCPASVAASGSQLDGCFAVHAEQNALLQCANVMEIETCVVTCEPCMTCVKLLMNTSCKTIIAGDPYPHSLPAMALWALAPDDMERRWVVLGGKK